MQENLIFISPHFDDICFSLGAFINKNRSKLLNIINIYTKSNYVESNEICERTYNLKEKELINFVSNLRKIEDEKFAKKYKIKTFNLNLKDAGLNNNVWSIEYIDKEFKILKEILIKLLQEMCLNDMKNIIFFPIGIGFHRNHYIVNQVMLSLLKDFKHTFIMFEDIPYINFGNNRENFFHNNYEKIIKLGFKQQKIEININELKEKQDNIFFYRSQISNLEFNSFDIKKYTLNENKKQWESIWIK